MTKTRLKLLIGGAVLAGAIGYLGVTGVRSGWVYYLNVDEYAASERAQAARARVHGTVAETDLVCRPAELFASFTLVGETQTLPVVYRGPIPDLFKAGQQVVIEGTRGTDGRFEADVLMTKCASKYEARAEEGGSS